MTRRVLSPEGVAALEALIAESVSVAGDGTISVSSDTFLGKLAMAGVALVPIEPSAGLLASMAMRDNHGLFAPADPDNAFIPRSEEQRARQIEMAIASMRQLHEEVVGTGFYQAEREVGYAGLTFGLGPDDGRQP